MANLQPRARQPARAAPAQRPGRWADAAGSLGRRRSHRGRRVAVQSGRPAGAAGSHVSGVARQPSCCVAGHVLQLYNNVVKSLESKIIIYI